MFSNFKDYKNHSNTDDESHKELLDIYEFLVRKCIDVNVKDGYGLTPYDKVKKYSHLLKILLLSPNI